LADRTEERNERQYVQAVADEKHAILLAVLFFCEHFVASNGARRSLPLGLVKERRRVGLSDYSEGPKREAPASLWVGCGRINPILAKKLTLGRTLRKHCFVNPNFHIEQ
jgi:hypothetical protein